MSGLFGSATLEVMIALFFIYLLLSIICSSIHEIIAGVLKWRAYDLEKGIANLLCSDELGQRVLKHPLIKALGSNNTENALVKYLAGSGYAGKPSYIPSRTFTLALFDSLAPASTGTTTVSGIRDAARCMAADANDEGKQQIGTALLALIEQTRDPHMLFARVEDFKAIVKGLPETPEQQTLREQIAPARTLDEIRALAMKLPESNLRQDVLQYLDVVQVNLTTLRKNVETWYDNAMDRVSGVYKRRTQVWLVFIAFAVTLLIGADTLRIITTLSTNTALRTLLVDEASRTVSTTTAPITTPTTPATATVRANPTSTAGVGTVTPPAASPNQGAPVVWSQLAQESQLFGYGGWPASGDPRMQLGWIVRKVAGLLLTGFAVALGAPFWFDVLMKIVNLRSTGKLPGRSEPQTS